MIKEMLPLLQVILALANICMIGYAFVKFLGRPHSTLDTRVTALEVKIKECDPFLNVHGITNKTKPTQVILHPLV